MKLKIFSDRSFLPKGMGHFVMLYPFWGKNPENEQDPNTGRFDHYAEIGRSFFKMTSLKEAEFAILPLAWEHVIRNEAKRDLSMSFVKEVKSAGKPVIVFFWSDSDQDIPLDNAVVFRTSFYRSKRKSNEFAMPAWSEDFVEKYLGGRLPIRLKRTKPIVGFCGSAPLLKVLLMWKLKNILRWGANFMGIRKKTTSKSPPIIRAIALHALSRSPLVEKNFIIRDRFLGGALLPNGRENLTLKQKVRLEYMQNIVRSDYILCARGAGNYSYRLYETLCCGRIPVFIDTDCVLPYDLDIKWKKHCVWIDESELPLVAEKVVEFHKNLSPQDFIDLQYENRKLWENWLSPEGFFANFHRHFN